MPERPKPSRFKIPLRFEPTGFKRGYDIYPPSYDKFGQSIFYPTAAEQFGLETREFIGGRSVDGETFLIKPLRFGSVTELKLYGDARHTGLLGLNEYIRTTVLGTGTPVYIFDDHNHAAFAICEAHSEGRLFPSATMIHIDAHDDGTVSPIVPNTRGLPPLSEVANMVQYYTDIESFIDPIVNWGLVREVIWVDPEWNNPPIFMPSQGRSIISGFADNQHQVNRISVRTTPMEIWDVGDLEEINPINPRQLIVDIDIDFFAEIPENSTKERGALGMIKRLMQKATIVTVATSPGYINQERALSLVRRLPLE